MELTKNEKRILCLLSNKGWYLKSGTNLSKNWKLCSPYGVNRHVRLTTIMSLRENRALKIDGGRYHISYEGRKFLNLV